MSALRILLSALAVWRLTHLLATEDGPWRVFERLRGGMRRLSLGELVDCFYCLSIWLAAPFAVWLGVGWAERLVLWLALSAAAILINRLVQRAEPETAVQAAEYYEEAYEEEKTEWHAVEAQNERELTSPKRSPARSA